MDNGDDATTATSGSPDLIDAQQLEVDADGCRRCQGDELLESVPLGQQGSATHDSSELVADGGRKGNNNSSSGMGLASATQDLCLRLESSMEEDQEQTTWLHSKGSSPSKKRHLDRAAQGPSLPASPPEKKNRYGEDDDQDDHDDHNDVVIEDLSVEEVSIQACCSSSTKSPAGAEVSCIVLDDEDDEDVKPEESMPGNAAGAAAATSTLDGRRESAAHTSGSTDPAEVQDNLEDGDQDQTGRRGGDEEVSREDDKSTEEFKVPGSKAEDGDCNGGGRQQNGGDGIVVVVCALKARDYTRLLGDARPELLSTKLVQSPDEAHALFGRVKACLIGGEDERSKVRPPGKPAGLVPAAAGSAAAPHHDLRRVSDVSSLSSNSRSTSSTLGYLADVGSGASTMSGGSTSSSSKRDRLSILPEATVEFHRTISPLPTKVHHQRLLKLRKDLAEVDTTSSDEGVGRAQPEKPPLPEPEQDSKGSSRSQLTQPRTQSGRRLRTRRERVASQTGKTSSGHNDASVSATSSAVATPQPPPLEKPEGPTTLIPIGTKVFAKWADVTDTKWWPGVVSEPPPAAPNAQENIPTNTNESPRKATNSHDPSRIYVKYYDGTERGGLALDDVIPVGCLEPGHWVNVSLEDEGEKGVYCKAVLLMHPDESGPDGDVMYTVEYEAVQGIPQIETQMVSHKRVLLGADQARRIRKGLKDLVGVEAGPAGTHASVADVSLDNLVEGKRKTPSRQSGLSTTTTPLPPRGGRRQPSGKGSKGAVPDDVFRTPKTKRSAKKGGSQIETSANEDDEVDDGVEGFAAQKGCCRAATTSSGLFSGMTFVLTKGAHPPQTEDEATSAMETETDDLPLGSRDAAGQLLPDDNSFNVGQVRALIGAHGGEVLAEFPGAKQAVPKELVVLSDRNCLTMTFMLAIGFGFPRVSYLWVRNSVSEGTKLPLKNYLLPVGWSSVERSMVEHHHDRQGPANTFKDLHVLVTSARSEFGNDWKPLLVRLGACVSFRSRGKLDRQLKKVHVVVADVEEGNLPATVVQDAKEKQVPVVAASWVMQSLINGRRIPYEQFSIV